MYNRPGHVEEAATRCVAGPFCGRPCAGKYSAAKNKNGLPQPEIEYQQWCLYVKAHPVYYTANKGGETVADLAERISLDLPTEADLLANLPRSKTVENRKPRVVRPCVLCGTSTKNEKYCSAKCQRTGWGKTPSSRSRKQRTCTGCGVKTTNQKYCSHECFSKTRRKTKRPSKEKLHRLVWKYPTSYIAKRLGVSDNTVAKWCRQYSIDKPPRGYWAKKRAGKLDEKSEATRTRT